MTAGGPGPGRVAVIGVGPGAAEWTSPEAAKLVEEATDVVGYAPYVALLGEAATGKCRHESDNREELHRARLALDLAREGRSVALVSSGDPGVFGMAAALFEALEAGGPERWRGVDVVVAPGISAMFAAAARAGAPLGHDFCAISLSDHLKPWAVIERRLAAAASADFVVALYNPASSERRWQFERAIALLRVHRDDATPVVLARSVGRPGEEVRAIALGDLKAGDADMRTLVIVGSSQTRMLARPDGGPSWVYTPRTYPPDP